MDEKLLKERLITPESARRWSPRLVSKLDSHIRSADDAVLLRINPIRLAVEKDFADLFLHSSAFGIFEMTWILICPVCSSVIDRFRALRNLNSHRRCTNCRIDLVTALDDMIAITFAVSAAVRRIAYHDPETRSVDDYTFRYRMAEEGQIPRRRPSPE